MSVQQLITDQIALWTGAVTSKSTSGRGSNGKIELTGIKKLRELILELAVRGKLVAQDSGEEPASVLLEKISKEKSRLLKEGKFKSLASDLSLSTEDKSFRAPKGWEWCRLDDIAIIARGGSPRPIKSYITVDSDGLNWIKIGDAQKGSRLIEKTAEKIRPAGLTKTRLVYPGDLILSNSMSFGQPYIMNIKGCIHDGWLLLRTPDGLIDKVFLYYLLLSPHAMNAFIASAAGAVVQNLNADKVRTLPVPLPPTGEQARIVKKIDELMALCDRLEQQTSDQLAAHETLVDTLLDTLTQSQNATELADNWARLAAHFDTLFTTEQSIDKLKQAILQLAVMGRLVEQDAKDEPANALLARLAKCKQTMHKAGTIKKQKLLPPISEDERYLQLPTGWAWASFGDTGYTRLGKMLDKAKNSGMDKPYLRNTNVQWWTIHTEDVKELKLEVHELDEYRLESGDLLICEGGEPGRCAVWRDTDQEMYFQKAIHRHKTLGFCSPEFLKVCLTVDYHNGKLSQHFTGATIKHLPGDKLATYVCPVPPVSEQHRIIQKVEELMALCNQLKARLNQADETRRHMAEAVVEQSVS